jgi:tRNA threonylcarbamoyladenosine biosynthesis protein TsaE
VGQEVAIAIKKGIYPPIVCLYGELGSGKTTFVQGLARGLGLIRTRLPSPTFIIVRRYEIGEDEKFFHHMDLYRMQDEKELEVLGLAEIFANPNNYVAIEWPERLNEGLPTARLDIHFRLLPDGSHEIRL